MVSNITNIGVDIDGCIADFNSLFISIAASLFGNRISLDYKRKDIKTYDYSFLGLSKEEIDTVWSNIFNTKNLWRLHLTLLNYSDWNSFLELQYNENINVYFVTSRKETLGGNTAKQTSFWLRTIGWNYPSVIVSDNKHKIINALNIKYMLDDSPYVLEGLLRECSDCKSFAFNWPYNKEFDGPRVNTLLEYKWMILRGMRNGQ